MRERKYRGQIVNQGVMVYGSLCAMGDYGMAIFPTGLKWVDGSELQSDDFSFVEVDTIGEFIGLPDKNDTEVYEGDVVFYHKAYRSYISYKGVVVYDEKQACFCIDTEGVGLVPIHQVYCKDKFEVTGNIHE